MGQLKWRWYSRERSLEDFETLAEAAREPLAALLMMLSHSFKKTCHWAYLGACVILLAVLVDPFLQQILSYPSIQVEESIATVPRAQAYDAGIDYTAPSKTHSVTSYPFI